MFFFLSLFLLGRFIFSSVYWPSVVFVHLLRNSVESQFLRDGVLPLGRVISYDFFVYGQAREHAPGCCCCCLFPREGLRLCLLFLIPCSVCIGVSPLPRSFRVPSSRISWGLFRLCSYSVWFGVLRVFLHCTSALSPRPCPLSLCLLIVLLALSPRPLCPSFSVVSFSNLSLHLLPLLFRLPLLHPLRVLLLPFLRCCAVRVGSRGFSLGPFVAVGAGVSFISSVCPISLWRVFMYIYIILGFSPYGDMLCFSTTGSVVYVLQEFFTVPSGQLSPW